MKINGVSVVIPNWNGRKLLEKNLPQVLEAKKYSKNMISEVIVVDDASEDNSIDYLEKLRGDIRIIKHKKNRGFSSSVNMGVNQAYGEYVCLLNTDVSPSVDFLEHAIRHFENESVFAVSLHERGYGPAAGRFEDGFVVFDGLEEKNDFCISFWANGGSALYSRKIWLELKGMDEKVFSPFYWEDIDLSYRAWKRGYSILWEPRARVLHEHESVINEKHFNKRFMNLIKERNQLLFVWKNITSENFFSKHKKNLIKRSLKHPGYLRVIRLALKKRDVALKSRETERKESKISDEAVFSKFETE